jgi:NADH-quinone oxidoreductase subunit N
MTVFMLGLAGIPPTAGFVGKLYLFSAALSQGHVALVIVAVLNSVAAVYYYLRPVVVMYMTQPEASRSRSARPCQACSQLRSSWSRRSGSAPRPGR